MKKTLLRVGLAVLAMAAFTSASIALAAGTLPAEGYGLGRSPQVEPQPAVDNQESTMEGLQLVLVPSGGLFDTFAVRSEAGAYAPPQMIRTFLLIPPGFQLPSPWLKTGITGDSQILMGSG